MEKTKENTSINIVEHIAKNLLDEVNRHDNMSLYRTLCSNEVIKCFDELLFYSRNVEKIIFFKHKQADKKWCSKIIYRTESVEPSSSYELEEEIVLPFAQFWTKDFEYNVSEIWKRFYVSSDKNTLINDLAKEAILYLKSIKQKSNKKLSIVWGPCNLRIEKQKLIILQKAIYLMGKKNDQENMPIDQMPFENLFTTYHNWFDRKESFEIITSFYEKILESKLIECVIFLPETSNVEKLRLAKILGFSANEQSMYFKDLPEDFTDNFWIKFLHQKTKQ